VHLPIATVNRASSSIKSVEQVFGDLATVAGRRFGAVIFAAAERSAEAAFRTGRNAHSPCAFSHQDRIVKPEKKIARSSP
jgi:hypothetical protein